MEVNYGPENPHPLSQLKTELVWEGKYDEYGRRREVALPQFPLVMQKIETIDEPRDRSRAQGSLFNESIAHRDDFRNCLVWGDNKLALCSLIEQYRNQIGLIYIDPPFDVGTDFRFDLALGDSDYQVKKEQSVLEAVAYRDTWGKGADSYLQMLYERLVLARELMSCQASIYVHVGWQVSASVRAILDDIFGANRFLNEVIWQRTASHNDPRRYGIVHDSILFYTKGDTYTWNDPKTEHSEDYIESFFTYAEAPDGTTIKLAKGDDAPHGYRRFRLGNFASPHPRPNLIYEYKGYKPPQNGWKVSRQKMEELDRNGRLWFPPSKEGRIQTKSYLDEVIDGKPAPDIWTGMMALQAQSAERLEYTTQKPEALLERIISASSNSDEIVCDFFCGSGTTLAVAEKLGRKWIGVDLGRYAIHTTRKRLIGVQRDLNNSDRPYRSFDLYNLGRYERQWWQLDRLKGANEDHRATVLRFFRAQPLKMSPSELLHGSKSGAFVHVDNIDSLLTFEELENVTKATSEAGGRNLICLAWEFQMDLKTKAQALEAKYDINISLRYIPREIMEPNRTEVQFFEAAALDAVATVKAIGNEKTVDVKLTQFIPSLSEVPEKELEALRERAVKSPFDFIDFWAIDFEHRDDKPFEHHWQDYRTRKERKLLTESNCHWKYTTPGKKLIRIKVIDVFGIDTTKVIEVTL